MRAVTAVQYRCGIAYAGIHPPPTGRRRTPVDQVFSIDRFYATGDYH
jgi:hypothetical protein